MSGLGAYGSPGRRKYRAHAVDFDGTNDWLDHGSAGMSDSKLFTGSVWLRIPAWLAAGSSNVWSMTNGVAARFELFHQTTSGQLRLFGRTSAGTTILELLISSLPVDTWFHLLISFDMATGWSVYVDDADHSASVTENTFTDGTVEFSTTDFQIASRNGGNDLHQQYIADLWMDFGARLDITSQANRRRFIDPRGKPVRLGADGSQPIASQVDFVHNKHVELWDVNGGSGGTATLTGTLTAAPSSPSD